MRSTLLIAVVLLSSVYTSAQEFSAGHTVSGTFGASRIVATVPLDSLLLQKSWDGDADDSPPLTCENALKSTRSALLDAYPEIRELNLKRTLVLNEMSALTVNEGKSNEYTQTFDGCWMYCVTYYYLPPASDHPELERIHIPVIMLMDGTTYVAMKPGEKAPNHALQTGSDG